MPVLQLLSDLHLERYSRRGQEKFFQRLDPEGVDVLILAGDIGPHQDSQGDMSLREILGQFCARYPQVVYVLGNHEYYYSSPEAVHGEMFDICVENKNLTWLDNSSAEVAGLKFIGGTLWFPKPAPITLVVGQQHLNDYDLIQDFEPWVYEQNWLCQELLKDQMSSADVVVTHHMPSASFTSPRFRREVHMSHFFYTELVTHIEEHQPPLWVFGHTHDRMWTYIRETTAVCNPLGYPNEPQKIRGRYVQKLLLDVGEPFYQSHDDTVRDTKRRSVVSKSQTPGK